MQQPTAKLMDKRTAGQLGLGLRSRTEEDASTGPPFYVRCERCKVNHIGRLNDVTIWLTDHQELHRENKERGQPF